MARLEINVDLNRVEGDLEIGLVLEDGVVVEARTVGTMYRGFEQILVGRAPRDALVMTPRVCGICGTAHLYAAVTALEHVWHTPVPPNATRIRNLCLIAEGLQNDLRQTFLFFAPDFCNPRHASEPWFDAHVAAFDPFSGAIWRETLAMTRRAVEIVAHFGGQWPHSSYMTPGGVTLGADLRRLAACRAVLAELRRWYEERIVGMALDDWLTLDDPERCRDRLAAQSPPSALALLDRAARALGLDRVATGVGDMISFGSWCDPLRWTPTAEARILPAGFLDGTTGTVHPLDHRLITEHVRHSWFRDYGGGRHPWQGETVPNYQPNSDRYTWAKAPRYADRVVQTGPIAELLIAGDPLIAAIHRDGGGGAWLRQFARIRRIAWELRQAQSTLDELAADLSGPHILPPPAGGLPDGEGHGLVMAARGALGHWIRIRDGVIDGYQIVTPTGWNASPRDAEGRPGHWEQSLVGLTVRDPDDPVEIGLVVRSHDPCLVCTVHMLDTGKRIGIRP